MKMIYYIKQNWDRTGVVMISIITILCIGAMVLDLHKKARVSELQSSILQLKPISSMISRPFYEMLVSKLKEPYVPERIHVRNVFAQYRKEDARIKPISEITEFKTIPERLQIIKIYRKPVKLLFKGYIQLADNSYVATINWAGKTDFKKVGEEIRGYRVVDFRKDVTEQKTLWGGSERIDKSIIVLERTTGEKFSLEIGHITLEKEIFAEIRDRKQGYNYDVHIESEILGHKVVDISSKEVIMVTSLGEKVFLKK